MTLLREFVIVVALLRGVKTRTTRQTSESPLITGETPTVTSPQGNQAYFMDYTIFQGYSSDASACPNICHLTRGAECDKYPNTCPYNRANPSGKICKEKCICGNYIGLQALLMSCEPENKTINTYTTVPPPLNITLTTGNCTINPSRPPQKCLHETCVHGTCKMETSTDGVTRAECLCDPGWMPPSCERCCSKPCGLYGQCALNGSVMYCRCDDYRYTGEFCEKLRPTPRPPVEGIPVSIIVAVSLGIVCFSLIVCMIIIYCLWKRRVVIILKLVYKFQKIEEDDDRIYDAFISYKNRTEDDDFVHKQLYPMLEKHFNFKLCLHHRDFEPGETIANNIIRAVESSRRTILILSPDYVRSEWPQMEYQVAQQEMLKRKHRIIPIMYKDMLDVKDLDKNLKFIVKTISYIEWPGSENNEKEKHFWEKLRLSMPKKSKQETDDSQDSVIQVP